MPEAVDMINLGFLTDSERDLILEVLQRDEDLRQAEEQRVRKLKTELLEVKRKGAKRGSGRYSQHSCGRCQEPLSRLTVFSSQCKMCNHHVCRKCQVIYPNGAWLCSVCAKESELKKSAGDWFYNQRANRFSTASGHELVRNSLKHRPSPLKKHETTGEMLLKSTELCQDPPKPVPRQKNLIANKSPLRDISGYNASRESPNEDVPSVPAHSDTESAENISLSNSNMESESGHVTPESFRKETLIPSSPAECSASSLLVPVQADTTSIHNSNSDICSDPKVKEPCPSPDLDVDKLFKKSIRRVPKTTEHMSTLDLCEEHNTVKPLMGNRSQSVPGLDIQDEEEEDIDSLVSFHRKAMASSSSSLHSSKSTLGSLMSIYSESGDYDSVEVSGDIVFSMIYDEHTQSLQIFIKECRGLAHGDSYRKLSNPYVKCYLLPDKSRHSKRKTSIKRHTNNPVYNETLKYSISRSQLLTRSILISVWHDGRLSRNSFLGEVELALDCRDLDSPQEDCMALMTKSTSVIHASVFSQYKGDLVISLKYISPKKENIKGKKAGTIEDGELHVQIKEAKNLMAMKAGGTTDSFVKGYLFPVKSKSTKKKTTVVKKTLNPHYDHTFVYKGIILEELKSMCLELTVWDKEALLSNEFLGGVRLSSGKGTVKIGKEEVEMDSVGEEISLWQKMMQYPDSWAEGTLPLRSSMKKNKGK